MRLKEVIIHLPLHDFDELARVAEARGMSTRLLIEAMLRQIAEREIARREAERGVLPELPLA